LTIFGQKKGHFFIKVKKDPTHGDNNPLKKNIYKNTVFIDKNTVFSIFLECFYKKWSNFIKPKNPKKRQKTTFFTFPVMPVVEMFKKWSKTPVLGPFLCSQLRFSMNA
jgi:hypothetical protein